MKKYTPVFGPQELFDGAANCDEYLVAVQHSVGQKTKVSFYPSLVEAFNYVTDFPPRGVVFHRAAMRKIEEVPDSQLVTDGMPSFYVGSSGACTHKMAESDIPVWCNDVDDTCTAMGFINDCLRLTRKPKRWTIADQKAGRLPEVGSLVMLVDIETKNNIFEFAGVCAGSKRFAVKDITDGLLYFYSEEMIAPIETPDEKAERLRSEWINKAYVDFHRLGCELEVLQKEQIKQIYDALLSGELTMPGKVDE